MVPEWYGIFWKHPSWAERQGHTTELFEQSTIFGTFLRKLTRRVFVVIQLDLAAVAPAMHNPGHKHRKEPQMDKRNQTLD